MPNYVLVLSTPRKLTSTQIFADTWYSAFNQAFPKYAWAVSDKPTLRDTQFKLEEEGVSLMILSKDV